MNERKSTKIDVLSCLVYWLIQIDPIWRGLTKAKLQAKLQELTAIPYAGCWNWERWNIEACCGLFAIFCIEAEAGKRAAILVWTK